MKDNLSESLQLLASIADELFLKKEFKVGNKVIVFRNLSAKEESEVSSIVNSLPDHLVMQESNKERVARAIFSINGVESPGGNDFINQAVKIIEKWPQAFFDRAIRVVQEMHNECREKLAKDNGIDLEQETQDQLKLMRMLSGIASPEVEKESLKVVENQISSKAENSVYPTTLPPDEANEVRKEFNGFPGKSEMPKELPPEVDSELFPPGK